MKLAGIWQGGYWKATSMILAALLLAACQISAKTPQTIPQTGNTYPPAIAVNDQDIISGAITVQIVISNEPGWVVIYASQNGKPGQVLGHAAVQQGVNRDVVVPINEVAATDEMFAGLHADRGTLGEFEFPGPDLPVELNGRPVQRMFHLIPGGSGTSEANLPQVVTVTMAGNIFQPASVTIAAGGRVVWVNDSDQEQTVTAEDHSFLSGSLLPGHTFEWSFPQPGRYPYYNENFGGPGGRGMSGVVVVR